MGLIKRVGQQIITPSTVNQPITKGEHNGSGYVKGEPNLLPANIKKGVSLYGVQGAVNPLGAGDTQIYKYPVVYPILRLNYEKIGGIKVSLGGTYRVNIGIAGYSAGTTSVRIYVNGVPVGYERSLVGNNTILGYVEDLTVNDGDEIQVWGKVSSTYDYYASLQWFILQITTMQFTDMRP
ncbi:hypothetical protein ACQKEY_24550 [Lysinibacillus fusiformis]|uniref:hypothetical protein n=1 Tax=Lysinibacillus fusiformis TaxID=28031 RepID=UPI003CFEA6BA